MSNTSQQNWTKEAPQSEQQIVGQKMVLILTKNARMVRNDIGLIFHNGTNEIELSCFWKDLVTYFLVTKTSMIRRFDGEGEKPKPVTEIIVTSLGDPTRTETMKWEGNETGILFIMT